MFGRVAVGIDDSVSAARAVDWAADEAARRHAVLRIVHVREPWVSEYPIGRARGFEAAMTEHCEGMLARAAEQARKRAPTVATSTHLATGAVIERLRDESEKADVLVVGSRGMGGFTGLLLGSVGLGLAGHTAGPLVILRDFQEAERHEVAVGVDGSPHSEAALGHAFEQAMLRHARVHPVHAWALPAFSSFADDYTEVVRLVSESANEAMRRWLAPWRERYPDVPVIEFVVCRHPVPALVDASEEADLIVVGSRGRGAVRTVALGSVGHGVLHRAHCPVAITPACEHA